MAEKTEPVPLEPFEHEALCHDFMDLVVLISNIDRLPISERTRSEVVAEKKRLIVDAARLLQRLTMPF